MHVYEEKRNRSRNKPADSMYRTKECRHSSLYITSSPAMAERPRKLSNFKEVGQFEAKF